MQDSDLAGALPYLIAAAVALVAGGSILLYERFSAASRRFCLLSVLVSSWFATIGVGRMAADPAAAEFWWGVTAAFQALSASAVYWLAVHLAGSHRRSWSRAAWAAGLGWFAWSLLSPTVSRGIARVTAGDGLTPDALPGLALILFVALLLVAAMLEFVAGARRASSITDRRRQVAMLIAMAVGAMSLVDYVIAPFLPGRVEISTVVIPAAVMIIGIAQVRYRAFAEYASFAPEHVLRALGEGVMVCDEMGVVRVVNPEALRLLGAVSTAVVGHPVTDFLAGPGRGGGKDFRSGRAEGELLVPGGQRGPMWLRPRTGEPLPVAVSAERLQGGETPRGWVIVVRDLRDRLAAEQALAGSEARYRSLFWHNPALAYEFDREGTIVQVNPSAEALFQVGVGGMAGLSLGRLVAPDHLDSAMEIFRGALSGEPQQYEGDVVTPAGRRTLQGVSVPVFEGDEVVGVFGVALDVTEEVRAKREADVQRGYFAELFEGSPEAIALLDESGVVQRVNGEFTRLFGYSRKEAVGRLLDDLIVPEGERGGAADLGRLAHQRVVRADLVRRRKEGGLVEVSLLARRLEMPGQKTQVYAIYRDVSDQRRTEQRLRDREEELRQAQRLEAVGKLAGGVAHDFNNLLTVINGHTRFLLNEMSAGDRWRADLQEIEDAGARAALLTRQLLAFSRRQVLRPEAVDLNAVVQDMERLLRRLIGPEIRYAARLAPMLPPVIADRGQVEHVLMNLVMNGRDAMPGGGTLTLRTEATYLRQDDPRLVQWQVESGAYGRLLIEDTGPGMNPDVLARVFDPFFTTKARGKGTGLGLATVFGIVKQSGGHVVAESEPGEGSRFAVYLPVATGAEVQAEPARSVEPAPSDADADATVLVVEDETSVRNLAVRVLEANGYTVIAASDGVEALDLVRSRPAGIDLVLSDLVMPRMGGRELARRIRLLRPEVRIVLMSGYDDEVITGGLDADDFLPKPFTPAELVESVAAALGSRAR